MKYVKTYENFSIGKMTYLILSKDRTKQLGSYDFRKGVTYFTIRDITNVNEVRELNKYDEIAAEKLLEELRIKTVNNYYMYYENDNWKFRGTLYTDSKELKKVIEKFKGKPMPISKVRIEELYPFSFGKVWKHWSDGVDWGGRSGIRAMEISQETFDSYPNQFYKKDFINFLSVHAKSYEQVSYEKYLETLEQFEVVPFFIGGSEQVTTEDEFVNL